MLTKMKETAGLLCLCNFWLSYVIAPVNKPLISLSEAYLGHKVKNAVITVPAYFNDSQRQVRTITCWSE